METIYLEQPKKHKYLNILLAVIFFTQGILNLVEPDGGFSITLGIIQILLSIFYGVMIITTMKQKSVYSPRITLSDQSISLKKDFFSKTQTISLDDIKLVQLKPEKLTVLTKEYDFAYSFPYDGFEQANNYGSDC
ncbi:hypothetical protein [Ekhidna sp.]|uniref:hypothetical protein n=1 Tax=Ekhidna sp. TaxID=2608089 RepID=UPI003BA96871